MDVVGRRLRKAETARRGGLVVVGAEYPAQPGVRLEGCPDAKEGVSVDDDVGVDEHEHVATRAGLPRCALPPARRLTGDPRR